MKTKTAEQILHKYFHHFKSERTRDLIVKAMEEYRQQSYASQPMSVERNKYKYLIERKDTNEWYCINITGYYGTTYEGETFGEIPDKKNDWTNNANDALQFNSRQEAELFIKGQEYLHDVLHFDCEITEHEFISENANPSPSPITQTTTSMSAEQVMPTVEELREAAKNNPNTFLSGALYVIEMVESTTPSVKAGGWVRVEDRLPEIIEGKDYSENVFAWCNGQIMIMCRTWVDGEPESGYVWANCYDDIDGEGIWDENYYPTHWQPLQLPSPPITE